MGKNVSSQNISYPNQLEETPLLLADKSDHLNHKESNP